MNQAVSQSVSPEQSTWPLVLASGSPRRRELLAQIGIEPSVVCSPDIDESPLPAEPVSVMVERLARHKAQGVAMHCHASRDKPAVVLAADTLVALDNQPLGKPVDREDFLHTFLRLAEREHSVLSAIAVATPGGELNSLVVETSVSLGPISEEEALAYWHTGEPVDKAGGYAIQGLGARFVNSISGSYSNVVGLPLYETARMLAVVGVPGDWHPPQHPVATASSQPSGPGRIA